MLSFVVMFTVVLIGCGDPIVAPSCENDLETSCFKGVFRTLLGQPVEGVEVCVHGDDSFPCVTTDVNGGGNAWSTLG